MNTQSKFKVTNRFHPQGCKEHHDAFKPKYGPWTAFRALDYGYTRMKIHNNTHLYMEQVSADKVSLCLFYLISMSGVDVHDMLHRTAAFLV